MKKIIFIIIVGLFLTNISYLSLVYAKESCTGTGCTTYDDDTGDNGNSGSQSGTGNSSNNTGSGGGGMSDAKIDCAGLLWCPDGNTERGLDNTFLWKEFIPYFIKKILELGAGIAVVTIVYSGALMATSGGEDDTKSKAVSNITYATIGLLVMILARAIVTIISNLPLGA